MPPTPTQPNLLAIWLLEYKQNDIWIQVPVLTHSQDGRYLYVKLNQSTIQLPRLLDAARWRIPSPSPDQPHLELDNQTIHWFELAVATAPDRRSGSGPEPADTPDPDWDEFIRSL